MPDDELTYRWISNTRWWTSRLIMMGSYFLFAVSAWSQCSITDATPIPDNDSITLGFNVSGLTNANLASPLQGICGVDISFDHVYLGDLTITLYSPAGTSVQLVGAPTGGTTMYTHFTTWDVHFVPCGSTANPDAGYSQTWSNDQVWNEFVTYTGSYYPSSGCLEDFNLGSANGQWLIVFQDHSFLEVGNVLSITLIFCDSTGLNCSACIPNGGILSPNSIDRCEGDNIHSSEISVDFGNNAPSPLFYGYQYLLTQGNNILQYGVAFSATLPAGAYSLCGFSYLLADSISVNADLAAGDLGGLQQDILSGAICGDISDICIPVEIAEPPDTVVIDTNICAGEVFSFGGQDYTSNGTFYQVHDGPGSCDSVFEIHIFPRTLNVIIDEPDTLFCNTPMVSLSASASGANGPFNFYWTTSFGNITSSNTLPTITVDQAGPYVVSVTDGICNGVVNTTVYADQGFPQIFVNEGTITCNQTSVDLNPIFIPSNGTLLWTGPGGFTSMQADINVTVSGNYELTVTNPQGCATTKQVTVGLDTTTYPINLFESSRNCAANQATLNANTGQPSVIYSWSGPNGFTTSVPSPTVTDAGTYAVTVTFLNGCQSTASMVFDGNFTIPDIMVSPNDTLNCSEIISLTVSSQTPGAQFSWQLPNGNGVGQATIQVQQVGIYNGYVSAPNGCNTNLPVEIVQGDDVFPYTVYFDTIDCNNPTAVIGVVSMQADEYEWLNYSGPDSNQSSITVSTPGIYNVLLADTNSHCNLLASIFVPSSFNSPEFGYLWDTISCLDPIAELSFLPYAGQTYASVYWELPDQNIVPGPVVSSDLPGTYYINAIGPNGCRGVQHFEVPVDTLPPFLLIEADSITCDDTARIESFSVDTIIMYNWSGPSILADSGSSILVNHAGIYTLQAAGLNGCINTFNVLVDSNYTLPVFTIMTDSLRCDMPATLSAISNEAGLAYNWFDPGGLLIASDSTIDVVLPGIYTVSVQGPNRCLAYDSVELEPVTYPQISVTTDTFTCTERFATLDADVDVQPTFITWLDENQDTISHSDTVTVGDDGPFYILVTGPNGCLAMDTISVPYDSAAPHAIISLIGEVRCQQRDVVFDGSGSTPPSILFDWNTIGGNILSDPSLIMINAQDSGWYQLIVTTPKNGCRDTAAYHLLPNPDEITQATFNVTRPQCHGDQNGAIELTNLSGGIGPFLYQLNGGPPQVNPVFNSLIAGMYMVTILDSAGCQYDTVVDIPVVPVFSVDAGPDQEIYIGETATLSGSTDLDPNEIQDQAWDSLDFDLCQSCPDFDVSPLETTTYTFELSSVTGCVLTDEVTVFVLEKGKYFIPNVFSPNGDGINDEIRIYPSPGIQRVLQWIIFDRWGNAVYGKTNFDPNDTSVFWDGRTSTGEFANPAVFPYIFEIQLINGHIELLHGNITLIR